MKPHDRKYSAQIFLFLVFLLCLLDSIASENLIQTINDTIGAENYTYYRVTGVGRLRLELVSMQGDADLYASHITLTPTYNDYELKSTTCGIDIVDIPAYLQRPIGVAVYGYPVKSNESIYSLSVYFVDQYDDEDYSFLDSKYHLTDTDGASRVGAGQRDQKSQQTHQHTEEEEKTISDFVWTILLTILKVVFEVLL
ncbi:UPF0669 protein C6orf120 homolog [Ylistrum balloti]|uniref:UPF0669 protein C6orf120 homolog n=1 Tax=Ylistrum balloti TaxID=509963 RepID=UPI002905B90B|nr:UPF0669 protein C6orf120 homolog [Ylistrum balloti]